VPHCEMEALERAIAEITQIAESFGLDGYPMRYEICSADRMYTCSAYGMPTRFSHWSFGKAFHRMKTHDDLGLSKMYELVINSNPCYAFLRAGNSLIQNKLIVAHVLGHSDFFKNNVRFSHTNRDMVETMSAAAERIHGYELEVGKEQVERCLDAVLSLQEHIDPRMIRTTGVWESSSECPAAEPAKDVLGFIARHASGLSAWQRDIVSVIREEMLYFWPQIETKIMNEGWASYWHTRLMRELDLTSAESMEVAMLHAAIVAPSRHQLNPYYLGYKLFEHIEARHGREAIFEVRQLDADLSFLRDHVTKDFVEELELPDGLMAEKSWDRVRDQLVTSRVNGGFPVIRVWDGDYGHNGELYLKHEYDGTELDVKYIEHTLPYVSQLWGRTVHLETILEDRKIVFTHDGQQQQRRFL
jgi:stage V sporulation protein R